MRLKNIDLRIEILSYLNEKNEVEYYPSCGFPIEIFIINENALINVYSKENLNASNFMFLSQISYTADLTVTLKKILFLGSYILYDHYSWNYLNNVLFKNNFKKLSLNDSFLVVSNIYLSQYLDTKLLNFQIVTSSKIKLQSLSRIYSNST